MPPVVRPGVVWEPCTVPEQHCETPSGVTPEVWAEVRAVAAFRLWQATGERFGECTHSADVCSASHRRCGRNLTGSMLGCGCKGPHLYGVVLPSGATSIVEVSDPSTGTPIAGWEVDWRAGFITSTVEFPELVSVDYTTGEPWPMDASEIIDRYAASLARTWCKLDGAACDLPVGVHVVQRDGVEYMVQSSEPKIGQTGIDAVDAWVRAAGDGYRPIMWTQDASANARKVSVTS